MPRTPEEQMLALLRSRDPRGFDLAYDAYAARVRSFLLRLSGRNDVADDLLQHTFLRLAERGPELRADSDLRAWLFTVARNAFLGQARALQAEPQDSLETLSAPSADIESRLLLENVEQALSRLRLADRELLLLVAVEGLNPKQVAAMLGVDSAAVRQRLARARSRLLAELDQLPSVRVARRKGLR